MQPNPLMKKLGYADDDRLVIVHCDDLGMCQSTITAAQDMVDFGLVSSYAAMVPCGWFSAVAPLFKANPTMDIGVHTTLTSEWDHYRWGPISTFDPATGLIDDEGYFHRDEKTVQELADPDAVEKELCAQIERAQATGIELTHIDSHMGTVFTERFFQPYMVAAQKYGLPALMFRQSKEQMMEYGLDEQSAQAGVELVKVMEAQGIPILDHLRAIHLDEYPEFEERLAYAKQLFTELPPGITYFIMHGAVDTPELRAITADWQARVHDYRIFTSPELRDLINAQGIHVIGWRKIKKLLPSFG
jgi:chitin disaccharide deacetylase